MFARWLAGLTERARAFFARGAFEADLEEELRFHLEEATERNIRRGMTPAEARRAARLQFGGVEQTKERVRSETGVRLLQDLAQDVRYALRGIRRRPGFALVAVLTVAVSVGAAGAVFGVVHSVLLRPLPYPDSERLVSIFNGYPNAGNSRAGNSVPDFYDRRELVRAVEDVALHTRSSYTVGGGDGGRRVAARVVTPSFFSVLRIAPILGRGLAEGDDGSGIPGEVVIAHGLWQSRFGGSRDAIGATLTLDGDAFTVVGVLPASFRFSSWNAEVFTSLAFTPKQRSDAARHRDWYAMIGRLAPGATVEAARSEIEAVNRARVAAYPPALRTEMREAGFHTAVRPYLADLTRGVRKPFALLAWGVLLILAIGAANVTSLLLVRARARAEELALRAALGAVRSRILRQFVTESTLLALTGGALGLLAAQGSLRFLGVLEVYGIPRLYDVSVDPVVVACVLLAVIALGAVAGAAPAVVVLRRGGASALQGRRGGMARRTVGFNRGLVAAQIALAFVLLMGAGLLLESLRELNAVDPGFDPDGVGVAVVSLPDARYPDEAARLAFAREMLESLGTVPALRAVAIADRLPFPGGNQRVPIVPAGPGPGDGEAAGVPYQTVVSPAYFEALSIDVVSGRGLRERDDRRAPRVAVIDEVLARRYWPGRDPVGQRIWRARPGEARDPAKALTVVGVVESVTRGSLLEGDAVGAFYVPVAQVPLGYFRVVVRHETEWEAVWPVVRDRIAALDAGPVVAGNTTLEESVSESLVLQRTPMQLLSVFAFIGLFLGAVGVYGVMAYTVGGRRREIGLRMAIGSTQWRITALLGREALIVVGLGVAFGALGALASTRLIDGLLYDTRPLDPGVAAGVLGTILAAALLACFLPIRRAVRVDPATVLRTE